MHSFTSRDLLVSVLPDGAVGAVACVTACTNEPTKGVVACATACTNEPTKGVVACVTACTNEPTGTQVQRGWDADVAGERDLALLERELAGAIG